MKEELDPRRKMRRNILRATVASIIAGEVGYLTLTEEGRRISRAKGTFSEREQAARELSGEDPTIAGGGVTAYQRQIFKHVLSGAIERGVNPQWDYRDQEGPVEQIVMTVYVIPLMAAMGYTGLREGFKENDIEEAETERERQMAQWELNRYRRSMDSWRVYLGMRQQNATFGISKYKPEQSTEDRYYYTINNFLSVWKENMWSKDLTDAEIIKELHDAAVAEGGKAVLNDNREAFIMRYYTLSAGEDERGTYISYYDRWNLERSIEGENGLIGRPYEIYDRIYYNPQTFEPLTPQP